MPNDIGSRVFLVLLALLTAALFAGLRVYGVWLVKEVGDGIAAARATHTVPAPPTEFVDARAGVTINLPAGVTPQISALGVLLKRDQDGMKAALVCPLVADRSIAPAEVLTGIHRVWAVGMKESAETLTLGNLHDEGAMVHATIESGRGLEAIAGELRVYRAPPGLRVEAFWTPKDEFDRERAQMEALTRTVRISPGVPMPVQVGKHHQSAVPPGFKFVEDAGGLEVVAIEDERVAFGLATGKGHGGLKKSEQLIDHYLTRSQGLSEPTTGLMRAYPTIDSPKGQTWDITARDLEYQVNGKRVRAVITAALTAGPMGEVFMLSVRQAPPDKWTQVGFTLSAIEGTARFFPFGVGTAGLALPIAHPEGTWELLEGWSVGRAMRAQGTPRWREAMLPSEQRVSPSTGQRWALPPWLAQPDGSFTNPDSPLEIMVQPAR